MKAGMEVVDSIMRECVVDYPDEPVGAPSFTSLNYTVKIYSRNTTVSVKTSSEEEMAEIVYMVKEYLNGAV